MKKRILTGITPSGRPHLGNILGAVIPAIELSKNEQLEAFYFISDLHSVISVPDALTRKEYTKAIAAAWLAFGLDVEKIYFYRQSKVPQVCELTWYLNCLAPFPLLANAHAFKSKSENMAEVTSGLFTYPVLMAADIILYDTHFVPVGKDQKQHIEIARDIAKKFNNLYGEIFILPEEVINEDVQTIIGTDGRKMSKSYDNYIDIFAPDKELKKQVMRIQTDSTPVEAPKNPDTCNVFNLYKLIAPLEKVQEMRTSYLAGGYGYGAAKNALLEGIKEHFSEQREKFNFYMSNPEVLEQQLTYGETRVQKIANEKLTQVRKVLGFE